MVMPDGCLGAEEVPLPRIKPPAIVERVLLISSRGHSTMLRNSVCVGARRMKFCSSHEKEHQGERAADVWSKARTLKRTTRQQGLSGPGRCG
eukprot:1192434-Prorocentrum_minimum.AAC.2